MLYRRPIQAKAEILSGCESLRRSRLPGRVPRVDTNGHDWGARARGETASHAEHAGRANPLCHERLGGVLRYYERVA